MEQWEKELREQLERELPDGPYQLGDGTNGGLIVWTGKGGKINFEVALHQQCLDYLKAVTDDEEFKKIDEQSTKERMIYGRISEITEQKLREYINNLHKQKDDGR